MTGRRGTTPGLVAKKRKGGRDRLYWNADSVSRVKAKGFPDRWIPLPDATSKEIEQLCEAYTERLEAHHAGSLNPSPRYLYDGTVAGLCDAYERRPESPIKGVRRGTALGYADSLQVIRATVGARAVARLTPIDVKGWYRNWRAPKQPGGRERIKRAHDAVAVLKMVVNFGCALGLPECCAFSAGLSKLRFEKSPPRESAMTAEHAKAFIATALERGDLRGLYMAISVATQFETMLRQKDVIGEWLRDETAGREVWTGSYTWENIPGGIFRLKTSKTGAKITHDLTRLELLWPLLQQVPQHERTGAVVKAYGEPIRVRSYRKWYREIANKAGIPSDVWNMDARAGAVTEALEAGADRGEVQRTATHATPAMTARYDRKVELAPASVAAARQKARRET